MKTLALSALLLTFVTTSCCTMRTQVTDGKHASATFNWKLTRRGEMPYLLYLPKGYSPHSKRGSPLMLFLHGSGERGTNVQRAGIHGPMSLVKSGKQFPFIIVAPLCPAGEQWENDSLSLLLDHVMKKFRVDTKRVYLTGLSMGGYGTWSLGITQPERFAAIAPICGGGSGIDVILGGRDRAAALKSLPVWAFHGAKDSVVLLEESERMVNALKKLGAKDVKLTVYPEAEHNSWTETYNNPELYEWLLKQHR
jgi:predicted peptidase